MAFATIEAMRGSTSTPTPTDTLLGYWAVRTGSFTATGNSNATTFTIPHGITGLAAAPSFFQVNAASADAKGISYVTADATGIIVHYDTAPATGANLVFTWSARL